MTIVSSQVLADINLFTANEIGVIEGGGELTEEFVELKTGKLSKSQNLAKSEKKLPKSGNLPNFITKDNRPSFLIPKAKVAFNYLWLTSIKVLILQHFDPECHIW